MVLVMVMVIVSDGILVMVMAIMIIVQRGRLELCFLVLLIAVDQIGDFSRLCHISYVRSSITTY